MKTLLLLLLLLSVHTPTLSSLRLNFIHEVNLLDPLASGTDGNKTSNLNQRAFLCTHLLLGVISLPLLPKGSDCCLLHMSVGEAACPAAHPEASRPLLSDLWTEPQPSPGLPSRAGASAQEAGLGLPLDRTGVVRCSPRQPQTLRWPPAWSGVQECVAS